MKAVVFHEYGPIEVLQHEDVPTPKPSAGEVFSARVDYTKPEEGGA